MNFLKLKHIASSFLIGFFISLFFTSCEQPETSFIEESQSYVDLEDTSFQQKNAGFLRQQERLGGHTIERHVGKSTAYLRNRLNSSSISAASTFYELNQAGQLIVNAINANRSRINNWLTNGSSRLTLNYTHRRNVGVVLRRGQNNPNPSRKFRVILQKRSNAPNGYYVLTSYPN